jgi:hypothetical protein
MDEHPLQEYDFLPTLPELCEKSLTDLKDEVGYIFSLYGFALGYVGGCHPAKAWLALGTQLIRQLSEVEKGDWEEIQTEIANRLEERSIERSE